MVDAKPSMTKAALIGGASAGVASSIPFVSCLNVLCCALVIGGGFLAGYLLSQEHRRFDAPFGAGDGAKVGVFAALFFALASGIVSFIVGLIVPTDMTEVVDQMRDSGMDPDQIEMIEGFMELFAGGGGAIGLFVGIGFNLLIGGIFCTIGGLIAGAVFKRKSTGAAAEQAFDEPPRPPQPPVPPVPPAP